MLELIHQHAGRASKYSSYRHSRFHCLYHLFTPFANNLRSGMEYKQSTILSHYFDFRTVPLIRQYEQIGSIVATNNPDLISDKVGIHEPLFTELSKKNRLKSAIIIPHKFWLSIGI